MLKLNLYPNSNVQDENKIGDNLVDEASLVNSFWKTATASNIHEENSAFWLRMKSLHKFKM